jgi:hypothetical protein
LDDKLESSIYNSGIDLNQNSWNINRFIENIEFKQNQYDSYLIPIERTNWRFENNSDKPEPTRIFFNEKLIFEIDASSVRFGPFFNGITELYVCYWADHEGCAEEYFGYIDINGNFYFDYEIKKNDDFDCSPF